jgi:hypothetical protein
MQKIETFFLVLLFVGAACQSMPSYASNMSTSTIQLSQCDKGETWDLASAMCMPLGEKNQKTTMIMHKENLFLVGLTGQSPRMRTALAIPNMLMTDIGSNFNTSHYFNLDLMGTLEVVSFPVSGYPELMQIGEQDEIGRPYIDNQHPHPYVMGITLSDTFRLSDHSDEYILKLFLSPRGETTEGPIAFMHRPTGVVNPDAPLGHHLGQDSGHVSSSVAGFSAKLNKFRFEGSAFYGQEPSPTKFEVPISTPNSFAGRIGFELTPSDLLLASLASVKNPEVADLNSNQIISRYSVSMLNLFKLSPTWSFTNQLIYGLIYGYDNTTSLNSWGEEFLFEHRSSQIWSRFEYLQRTPAELGIPGGIIDYYAPRWVGLATLGYAYKLFRISDFNFFVGSSASGNFIPGEFTSTYGSLPLTGRLFLRLSGDGMF